MLEAFTPNTPAMADATAMMIFSTVPHTPFLVDIRFFSLRFFLCYGCSLSLRFQTGHTVCAPVFCFFATWV